MTKVVVFLRDQSGATSFECGLVAAGVAIAVMAAINSMGAHLFR